MSTKFLFTDHAVEQFITRYDRTLSYEDGKLLLETVVDEGDISLLTEKTFGGEEQWHMPTLRVVLITKPRRDGNIVVTVVQEEHLKSIRAQIRHDSEMDALAEFDLYRVPAISEPDISNTNQHVQFVLDVEFVVTFPNRAHALELIQDRLQKMFSNGIALKRGKIKSIVVKEHETVCTKNAG